MNLISKTISACSAVLSKAFEFFGWGGIGSGGAGESGASGALGGRGAKRWLKAYKANTYLKAPIQRIARDMGAIEWHLDRIVGVGADGQLDTERVHSHPFWTLWCQPNFLLSLEQYMELGATWLETTGRWATWIERHPATNLPWQLHPIVPSDILSLPTRKRPQWRLRLNGKVFSASPADVIWITYVDPEAPTGWGLSPAEAVASEVEQTQYANRWNLNFFRNGTNIGKIVGIPGLTKENGPKIQADFDARFKGPDNSHKAFFVGLAGPVGGGGANSSNISITDLQKSHKDMEFGPGLDRLADIIAMNWNMPRDLLGRLGNSNRSESDNSLRFHQRQNISPRAKFFCRQFSQQLLAEFQDPTLVLGYKNPVQEDDTFLLQQANDGITHGTMTVNEWRRSQKKDSLGPVGDVRYVAVNMAVVPNDLTAEDLAKLLARHNAGNPDPVMIGPGKDQQS